MFYAFCWRDEHPEHNRMQVSNNSSRLLTRSDNIEFQVSQQTQDMHLEDSEHEDEAKIEVTQA